VGALNAIESEPGDGQKMIGLFTLKEDLIGIKEGKTGRIPYGDPNSGWITEDSVIGIEDRDFAQFVPNIGICAIVNDQNDFRIFGYDLAWHSDLYGLQISRPIRNVISTFDPDDLDFLYINGKLMISGGEGILLVLNVEQKKGWGIYEYPLGGLSEAVFTFNEGRRALILNTGLPGIEIEVDGLVTDYEDPTHTIEPIDWFIETHKWQDMGGRALIEQRFLSIVAILGVNISCQPYVNGKLWDVPFNLVVPPEDYPDSALRETEYQGYSENKPIGNYIHYEITGSGIATIYSLMLNALIQRGAIPTTFDPFQLLSLARVVPDFLVVEIDETGIAAEDIDETGVAVDEISEES
jgi:hypothetical protein